jgi:SAM-dependent methyltransferase
MLIITLWVVMSIINYFNFYSLDFSRVNNFEIIIEQDENELASQFGSALKAERMKSDLARYEMAKETLERTLSLFTGKEEMPGCKIFKQTISEIQKANIDANQVLCKHNGVDPFEVQEITHRILGIPKNRKDTISDELRQHYFDLMKKSGFLITEYASVNRSMEQTIDYLPSSLALEFLKNHPEKKTLTIGCGEAGKTYAASCHFRRSEDHNEPSFTIDVSACQQPDLVVDMHDLDFWKAIPNEHFENIFDHSYGYFLLENPHSKETLQSIFRTLKPGGFLKIDLPFKEAHKLLLQDVGFVVEDGERKEAKKVL